MKRFSAIFAAALLACGGTSTQPTGPGTSSGGSGGESVEAGAAAETFRQNQPKPGAPRPFQLPPMKTFKLGDSIDVYLVESHDLPTITMNVVFEGGSMTDPKGKDGLAAVCMDMLTEGTKKLDKLAFERALADIGSDVWSWASLDGQGMGLRTLSKNFDQTMALFVDTLRTPGFRKTDLQRLVKRRIEGVKQAKGDPRRVVGRVLSGITFGTAHPNGRPETEKSLARITTGDCRGYHGRYIKPVGARLFVVGDLTEDKVRAAFEPVLASWKGKPAPVKMPPRSSRKGRIFFVDVPGAKSSAVYLTHVGPERKDPQYFAQSMMTRLFGGSFSSRINMNLREDKGYSYGARGGFSYSRDFGTLTAGALVRSDSTVQSIRELVKEMKNLHEGTLPATEAELSREKNGVILGLPASFATAGDALDNYRSLVYFGLPLDYYNSYVNEVGKVSLAQVNEAAKTWLMPEKAQLLVVGDGKAEMNVRDDSGKDVPMLDSDGKPVTLLQALETMAATGEVGAGDFVRLDADGAILKK